MIIYITIEINKMSLSCCNNAVKLISRTQEGNLIPGLRRKAKKRKLGWVTI